MTSLSGNRLLHLVLLEEALGPSSAKKLLLSTDLLFEFGNAVTQLFFFNIDLQLLYIQRQFMMKRLWENKESCQPWEQNLLKKYLYSQQKYLQ